jgi:hypothetical protein
MKKVAFLSYFFIVTATLVSCKKVEGEGGAGSITGKIMIDEKLYVNGIYSSTVSYTGATEDVYIVYGGGTDVPNDKVECGYDGTFKFNYLQPGTYTIYAYNEVFHTGANASNNDDDYYTFEPVKMTVELAKKESNDLGTITLTK